MSRFYKEEYTHTHTNKKKNLMSICFVLELITRQDVVYLE